MPGASESSTVEWHKRTGFPIDRRVPCELKNPVKPTTEFNLSKATVVAGSAQIDFPVFQCCYQCGRQRVYVHLEADGQRGDRTYSRPYSTNFAPSIAWWS